MSGGCWVSDLVICLVDNLVISGIFDVYFVNGLDVGGACVIVEVSAVGLDVAVKYWLKW